MGNDLPLSFESLADHPGWPFVGRVAQLKAVRQLVTRAKSGTGAVALIGAEPGLGKSRFLHEAAARESGSAVTIPLVCSGAVAGGASPLRDQLTAALRGRDLLGVARTHFGASAGVVTNNPNAMSGAARAMAKTRSWRTP